MHDDSAPRRPPTAPEGPTGALCAWLASLRYEDVPPRVLARAQDLILDGLGCALVGAQLPWSRTAAEAVFGFEGAGDAPVIGWGRTLGRPAAVLLNSTFIQGFELDDVHHRGPLHSASLVIPALLAVAGSRPLTGRDFLCAAVAGFETGPRVGMALHGAQMLSRGWHSGAVFGTHAAAAAACVALGLDGAAMEDALGMAGTQSGGLMAAQFEAMSKRMHHGFAARAGYSAAMMAAAGYTGIKRVFEREYGGFLAMFGEGHDPDASQIHAGLGERWETEHISIKPYAAVGTLHGPLDALFELQRRRAFRPDELHSLEVALSHAHYHHGWWDAQRPLEPIGAQMHLGYVLAVAILDGAVMAQQFAPDRIDRDDVWALMPMISARHEPELDRDAQTRMSSVLTAAFTDGTRETITIPIARTYAASMLHDEVVGKFRTLAGGVVQADRLKSIEAFVADLPSQESVQPLIGLLAPSVSSVFD